MAIINSVLGTMKGKLGNLSTRKALGHNILYARAQEVANPRTSAQMKQRVKLANVVTLYRVLRAFLESYAFENKLQTRSVYNEFVSLNLSANRVYLTKDAVKQGACVVAPYIISKGTLPMIGVQGYGAGAITDIAVDTTSFDNATVGDFAQAILASNPRFKKGDQLSYVSLVQNTGADGFPHISCEIFEVILDPEESAPLSDYMPARAIAVSNGFLAHSSESLTGAFAWVISRKEGGKVRVSTQALVLSDENINTMFNSLSKAIASYGSTDTPFLDPDLAGTIDGTETGADRPSIASVMQGSATLRRGMQNTALAASNIIVKGSNFADNLVASASVGGRTLLVTRNSDTQLTITNNQGISAQSSWTLTLKLGSYNFTLASSEYNNSDITEG